MIEISDTIKEFAQILSVEFDSDVYLVGPAVTSRNPTSLNIAVLMKREMFEEKYGPIKQYIEECNSGQWTTVKHIWIGDVMQWLQEGWFMGLTKPLLDLKIYWEGRYNGDEMELLCKFEA